MRSAKDLRAALSALRESLEALISHGEDGTSLGTARARGLDALLAAHFDEAASAAGLGSDAHVAMAAVGSYGRGLLALASDVDLRFVPGARAKTKEVSALVDAVMYPLWDAGLVVGHQIIDLGEVVALARDDLTTATSLLDLRRVAGDDAPLDALHRRAKKELFSPKRAASFVRRLEDEAAERHERFGGSVYLLEPDVKSGEGGLRDVDVLRWSLRASSAKLSDWVDEREERALAQAETFLFRVRNRLHHTQGRRTDRLTFDAQEVVAVAMGYGDAEESRALGAERLMQEYYTRARTISRLVSRAFERSRASARGHARAAPRPVAHGVFVEGDELVLRRDALERDPALALRVYEHAVKRAAPVSSETREAISRKTLDEGFCAALRESPEARAAFVGLVCASLEVPLAKASPIRELSDVGILHAMIPEFLRVLGRVHHDVYHVYTVDVHSVAAVDCLRALVRGDLHAAHPLASRLAAEIARPAPLFLATLIHDMGKGYPDADGSRKHHSERGAELCDVVLPRLGLSEDDVADARALVLHHLAMYHLATRRDLADPGTAAELARLVRGREGLRDLYLLTIADITTTAPNAMTSWKARMLEELYLLTDAFLAGESSHAIDDERVARLFSAAAKEWDGPADELAGFIASMPMRYRLGASASAIARHAKVARGDVGQVRVALVSPPGSSEHLELCVVAPDETGLLARIAAALTANRFEVLGAQVYSRDVGARSQAVDVFTVRAADANLSRALERLQSDLTALCEGKADARSLLFSRTGSRSPWRERPTPAVPVEIAFDERATPRATVIEVFAKDEPGLLYRLAQALADLGLSIALSKINTEGTKVADVFYVHEADGSKIKGAARFEEIRTRLHSAVSE